jgi:hypothetical protein
MLVMLLSFFPSLFIRKLHSKLGKVEFLARRIIELCQEERGVHEKERNIVSVIV